MRESCERPRGFPLGVTITIEDAEQAAPVREIEERPSALREASLVAAAFRAWEHAQGVEYPAHLSARHVAMVRAHLADRVVARHEKNVKRLTVVAEGALDRLIAANSELESWVEIQALLLLDVVQEDARAKPKTNAQRAREHESGTEDEIEW